MMAIANTWIYMIYTFLSIQSIYKIYKCLPSACGGTKLFHHVVNTHVVLTHKSPSNEPTKSPTPKNQISGTIGIPVPIRAAVHQRDAFGHSNDGLKQPRVRRFLGHVGHEGNESFFVFKDHI